MRKCFWIFFCLFWNNTSLFAQAFETQLTQIESCMFHRPDSALRLSQDLLLQTSNEPHRVRLKNLIGQAYSQLGQYNNGLKFHLEALDYYENQQNFDGVANSLNLLCAIYRSQNLLDKTIELCQRVIALQPQIEHQAYVGRAYREWAISSYFKKDYKSVLIYADKSLNIYQKINQQEGVMYALNLRSCLSYFFIRKILYFRQKVL